MSEWLFGAPVSRGGLSVRDEERMLGLYCVYVVSFPRVAGKSWNTAAYAECSISALRDRVHERHGRIPGGPPGECRFLRKILRGLHKKAPSGARALRRPILQDTLRAVRRFLDLANDAVDRVYWALWLTQWQGVKR